MSESRSLRGRSVEPRLSLNLLGLFLPDPAHHHDRMGADLKGGPMLGELAIALGDQPFRGSEPPSFGRPM
ncbi:hypothetical protein ABT294_10720 [Nonomuraea sp. NPDC000554]|uniref:hypothetical protein n=1 Tax=Nonomuraea sp. NPDC000554 TaxID=3154259 RepID=UPI0033231FE9